MNGDQIIAIHHSEQAKEGVREGTKPKFYLPKETLPQDCIANEEWQDSYDCSDQNWYCIFNCTQYQGVTLRIHEITR